MIRAQAYLDKWSGLTIKTREFPDRARARRRPRSAASEETEHEKDGERTPRRLLAVLPELLREHGIPDNLIERILTHNPARAFAFAEVSKAGCPEEA
jgi:hypothetical protein